MKSLYDNYLQQPLLLTFEEALRIMDNLLVCVETAKQQDEETEEIFQEFADACERYAKIRFQWNFLSRERKLETDSSRTSAHDHVIISHNMLMRFLAQYCPEQEWYALLGYEESNRMTRKTVGDFACYFVLFFGLNAR